MHTETHWSGFKRLTLILSFNFKEQNQTIRNDLCFELAGSLVLSNLFYQDTNHFTCWCPRLQRTHFLSVPGSVGKSSHFTILDRWVCCNRCKHLALKKTKQRTPFLLVWWSSNYRFQNVHPKYKQNHSWYRFSLRAWNNSYMGSLVQFRNNTRNYILTMYCLETT